MKRKQGVSLIVLIITIIVVIILATAVILSIANNNPIDNAKKARDVHNEAILKEAANLAYLDWYSENSMGEATETAEEYVRESLGNQGFSDTEIAKVAVTENGITVVVIPNGFEYLTGTVDTGYVIKNSSDGNEFVWVPVEDFSKFKRTTTYDGTITDPGESYSEPATDASETEVEEYNQMMESVKKYGGFYIARYEASVSEGKAKSVANKSPLGWNAGDTNTLASYSRAVYSSATATKEKDPVSTLCYGVQWDAAVSFIKKNYPDILTNSSKYGAYGNYYSSWQKTGTNTAYAQNNIYDMCGNALEYTMEVYSNNYVVRGGWINSSLNGAIDGTIATRDSAFMEYGFRLALYVK